MVIWIEEKATVPTEDEIGIPIEIMKTTSEGEVDFKKMNKELYEILSLKLKHKALTKIKNYVNQSGDINGFQCWWRIFSEAQGMGGQRTLNLSEQVYKPDRAKRFSDVPGELDKWEKNFKLYENI